MPIRDPQAVLQFLGRTPLKVDTYFLQRTGFVANQTILKLGEYTLNCVPATIGLEESRFLAVLTPVEVNHFARFKVGTQILILTFDDPEKKDIARFHLRVTLIDLLPVPDRKNICFLLLKIKSMPAEFALFLAEYLEALEARRESWEALASESTPVATGTATLIDAQAVVEAGSERATVVVTAFHTKAVQLTWPEGAAWGGRAGVQLRLKVRGQPLVLEGALDPQGAFLPEFHSDWLEFIEDLRFQRNLRNRAGNKAAP